jgi:hypothetical protein
MKLIPLLLLSLLVLPCSAADKAKKKEALLSQQAVTAFLYGDTGNVGSTVTEARGGSSFVGATGTYINIGAFAITKSPVGTIAIELEAN